MEDRPSGGEEPTYDQQSPSRGYDDIQDAMTASYSEISFHGVSTAGASAKADEGIDANTQRTTSQRPISLEYDKQSVEQHAMESGEQPTFPYYLADGGTVSIDGTMTSFVADHLEYKIKLASPVTKKETIGDDDSRTSTPSVLPRNFLQQSAQMAHQIDVNVLSDVEIEAQYLATSVDMLTENLCNLLHSISSLTADNVETYKNAVHKLTDCMDGNIKSMYTIMAKTEEISNAMRPTEQLALRM